MEIYKVEKRNQRMLTENNRSSTSSYQLSIWLVSVI